MKKIKLFILLLLVSIPMFVKADAAGPMITQYKIRISNQYGATVYELDDETNNYIKTNKVLEYDETYTVSYEEIKNKQLYGHIYEIVKEGEDQQEYIIKLSDAQPLKFNLQDYKQDESIKHYVFEDGVTLYQGPSKIYGKITPEKVLKIGETIETKYYDELWSYIEYEGAKGWIYTYENASASPYNESSGVATIYDDYTVSFKTIGPVELYTTPKSNNKVGVTIPSNTDMSNQKTLAIYNVAGRLNNYYIEYNGVKGWVRLDLENSDIAQVNDYYDTYVIAKIQGKKLYNNPNDEQTILATIPYLEKIPMATYYYWKDYQDYDNEHWLQVVYNGQIGWIKEDNLESQKITLANYREEEKNIKINNPIGLDFYKDLNDLESKTSTIPYQTKISTNVYTNTTTGTWYLVEYDNQEGWVFILDEESSLYEDSPINNDPSIPSTNSSSTLHIPDKSTSSISQKIIMYTCIVIVVCLTATVTVILINKKKKETNASK